MKKIISVFIVLLLAFMCVTPAFGAAAPEQTADSAAGSSAFTAFIERIFAKTESLFNSIFNGIKYYFEVKNEGVQNTMNKNAVHMLKSVTDTIGDSFIITTEDGKVIVIDAWFLSHPHTDHVEVFYEVAENRTNQVTFDKVLLNYPPAELYESRSQEEGMQMAGEFSRISKAFPEKVQILNTGDKFNIGEAKITVLYTADTSFIDVNEHSVIFRMDLGGKSIMFTGDAQVNAGNKTLAQWADSGLMKCDICKMAHHGQDGVDRNFYEAVAPEICLWPTPTWVWDNRNGNLKTLEVRRWMEELGVKKNYVAWQGSQVIYLG